MKIVLIGNQNSGKTTVFNMLTNGCETVGNWAGVTINSKEVIIEDTNDIIVDLPGIYSLYPYSSDEEVTTNYLLNEQYDVIMNIVDINLISRSLYLSTQLIDLHKKMLLVLTHTSKIKSNELHMNIKILEKELNIKVIDIEDIKRDRKILYKELLTLKSMSIINVKIPSLNDMIINKRYQYIDVVCKKLSISHRKDNIDKIVLNKYICIPLFILLMSLIYYFSIYIIGDYSKVFINKFIFILNNHLSNILTKLHVYRWLISLITDGIISGISSIILFLPSLISIFFFLELLKQTGYIARISCVFDGIFNHLGLSGKSLLAFLLGFNCSVTGILQTHIISDKGIRERTAILTPFLPCSAKLPMIMFITHYYFSYKLFFIIYLLAIIIVIIVSLILKKIYAVTASSYVMELPDYKYPQINYLVKSVWYRIKDFITRMGSIILISSIIIWFLISCNLKFQYTSDINNSLLSFIGNKISFLFYPFLGIKSWIASIAILQGMIAKEQVITSLSIISHGKFFLDNSLSFFNSLNALSFLTFNLFSIPCLNTVVTIKKELKSFRKLFFVLLLQFVVALLISTIIYRVGDIFV
ncbi:MAG: ferrous iron transporter B [Bacilli bacterium]|nr:ferrous iron transporter B [Bacilli bacterium]